MRSSFQLSLEADCTNDVTSTVDATSALKLPSTKKINTSIYNPFYSYFERYIFSVLENEDPFDDPTNFSGTESDEEDAEVADSGPLDKWLKSGLVDKDVRNQPSTGANEVDLDHSLSDSDSENQQRLAKRHDHDSRDKDPASLKQDAFSVCLNCASVYNQSCIRI